MVKSLPAMQEAGSILGSRSPGDGNGSPLRTLVWKISWTGELGGLKSMGCKELDMTERLITYAQLPKRLLELCPLHQNSRHLQKTKVIRKVYFASLK